MNASLLFTFLSVARTQNISKSAFEMNQAQSTISKRLQQIENFLGQRLFERKKGSKRVELTPKGEAFIEIAERWLSLYDELDRLRLPESKMELRVAGLDSLNFSFLGELYRTIIQAEPDLHLLVQSHFFQNMYSYVTEHKADVAFSFYHAMHPALRVVKLYSEPMVILKRSEKIPRQAQSVHLSSLPQQYEIYVPWSPSHEIWRHSILKKNISPVITIYPVSLVPSMMSLEKHWSIVPLSFATYLQQHGNFEFFNLIPEPPLHSCYFISHRQPSANTNKAIQIFEKYLMEKIHSTFLLSHNQQNHI